MMKCELPTIYQHTEDCGFFDEFHIWHRDCRATEQGIERPADFDEARPWEWGILTPSARLTTLASRGFAPGIAYDYHGDERITMLRDGKPSAACLEYVRVPYEPPAFGRSKLCREEIEYLEAWLLLQPEYDLDATTGRLVKLHR